jgi:hypothetical protein
MPFGIMKLAFLHTCVFRRMGTDWTSHFKPHRRRGSLYTRAVSDWSGVSTDHLITLKAAFDRRLENENGTVTITLNDVHWSRCYAIAYEIAHELAERDDRAS